MAKQEGEPTWRDVEIGAIVTEPGSASQYETGGWRTQRPIHNTDRCIKCGLCVRITEKAGERLGLTFLGRGFDVRVGVPFNASLEEALEMAKEIHGAGFSITCAQHPASQTKVAM